MANSNLLVINEPDSMPTFQTRRSHGWPDLTLVTPGLLRATRDWKVSDLPSLSDHRYIFYELNYDNTYERRHRLETKFGKHRKFIKQVKQASTHIIARLEEAQNKTSLEQITQDMQNTLTTIAKQCYRERRPPPPKPPTWWTPELKTHRNKLRAKRRRFQKCNTLEEEERQRDKLHEEYKKEQARYKKHLRTAKSTFWKQMCSATDTAYGTLYKKVIQQNNAHNEIQNITGNLPTANIRDIQSKFLTTHFITNPPITQATPRTTQPEQDTTSAQNTNQDRAYQEVTIKEIEQIIKAQKKNKAPGHDKIDNKLLKRINEANPRIFHTLINQCLRLSTFPKSLKHALVVLFKKPGKDAKDVRGYRPICLLPAIGKLLERVIQGRLMHFLETENKISKRQHGFRVLHNTEKAIHHMLQTIEEDRNHHQQTTAISIDITGAFDNIGWDSIKRSLSVKRCPEYLQKIIHSYLHERTVELTTNGITSQEQTYGGCPQGSCLGPVFWNLVADSILQQTHPQEVRIQAFADDFMLLTKGPTQTELITSTNKALQIINAWTQKEKLTINWAKTKMLYLNRPQMFNFNQAASYKLEGVNVEGQEIPGSETLQYLGVHIHKNLRWEHHCAQQKKKALQTFKQLNIIAKSTWGVDSKIIKIWYKTVAEKILLYAAPIWARHPLSPRCREILNSAQRFFTLAVTKAYRTAPSTALAVMSGIVPICIQAEYESKLGRLTRLQEAITIDNHIHIPSEYEPKGNQWLRHPAEQALELAEIPNAQLNIFTDGSKQQDGATGAAFVAFEGNTITKIQRIPLQQHNTVFQAELAAITEATKWAKHQRKMFTIHTDSQASIASLDTPFTTNIQVIRLKDLLQKVRKQCSIKWTKAHVGTLGNELADEEANRAAINEEGIPHQSLKKPKSYIKKKLKQEIIKKWQDTWTAAKTNKTAGSKTHKYIPKVSTERIISCRFLAQILTEHGATPHYLHRFKKKQSPQCQCGAEGTILHYLTQCTYTQNLHLRAPAKQAEELWHQSIGKNRHIQKKAAKIAQWLSLNIDNISD